MPRPGTPAGAKSAGTQKMNPVSRWFKARKECSEAHAIEAARLITNNIEDNAHKLIDELSNVDFIKSPLPESVLNDLQDPRYPYCKLEWSIKALVQMIQNDRQSINIDIRPIDENLLTLAKMFKQFVDHGHAQAAEMAKTALYMGIKEIRCKIPTYQPNLAEQFVKKNTEYLSQWINLVEWAQIYDNQKKNLKEKRASHENAVNQLTESIDDFRTRLQENAAFNEAFTYILNHDSPAERSTWNEIQRKTHTEMIDFRLNQLTLEMNNLSLIALESKQSATKQKMDTLWTQLEEIPIVSNPDLLNLYQEAMEKFVHDLAESDNFMEETLNLADQLEAALKQLDETPGAVLAKETASRAAQNIRDQIQKRQDELSGQAALDHHRRMRELGILTDEELQALRKANQEKIDQELQNAIQNTVNVQNTENNQNTQQPLNYN